MMVIIRENFPLGKRDLCSATRMAILTTSTIIDKITNLCNSRFGVDAVVDALIDPWTADGDSSIMVAAELDSTADGRVVVEVVREIRKFIRELASSLDDCEDENDAY